MPTATAPLLDLSAARRTRDAAVERAASAPVRHITDEFLAALNCRDVAPAPVGRVLRAV